MFSSTCVYGSVFESVAPKDNTILAGRNHTAHPFILETETFTGGMVSSLVLVIIFTGPSLAFAPYFFRALKNGGKQGILRERVPYTIAGATANSPEGHRKPLLVNDEMFDIQREPDVWETSPGDKAFQGTILVRLVSPLRFKVRGRYTDAFSAPDFALCLERRMRTLCSRYGSIAGPVSHFFGGWDISRKDLLWKDWEYYSTRQKKALRLGGVSGSMVLSGSFTASEYALLRFAEIFHAGKNTNFGLGKLALLADKQ
jgi:hypothetical protein